MGYRDPVSLEKKLYASFFLYQQEDSRILRQDIVSAAFLRFFVSEEARRPACFWQKNNTGGFFVKAADGTAAELLSLLEKV